MKAETQESPVPPTPTGSDEMSKLLQQYGCGPIAFTGTDNAFYERHLVFDNVIELMAAGPRERFEAVARSVRDILSQRWVHTETTYQRENPKRVYYLSMEFLIGRSLANNATNLLLDPVAKQAIKQKNLDWFELLEQEPDAGLGNGGSGAWRLVFSIRWRRCKSQPWATASDMNTASSSSVSRTAGNTSCRTTGSVAPTLGRSSVRTRPWTSSSTAHSKCAAELCAPWSVVRPV